MKYTFATLLLLTISSVQVYAEPYQIADGIPITVSTTVVGSGAINCDTEGNCYTTDNTDGIAFKEYVEYDAEGNIVRSWQEPINTQNN